MPEKLTSYNIEPVRKKPINMKKIKTYVPSYSRERQKNRSNKNEIRVTTAPLLTDVNSLSDSIVNMIRREIKKANYRIDK